MASFSRSACGRVWLNEQLRGTERASPRAKGGFREGRRGRPAVPCCRSPRGGPSLASYAEPPFPLRRRFCQHRLACEPPKAAAANQRVHLISGRGRSRLVSHCSRPLCHRTNRKELPGEEGARLRVPGSGSGSGSRHVPQCRAAAGGGEGGDRLELLGLRLLQ